MKPNAVYGVITDRITALLTQGIVPWHKPWNVKTGMPRNFVSKKPYRGINSFLLLSMSYESPFWLTFHQASQLGGTVRKGEKACPVIFWKRWKVEDKQTEETKRIPLLRYYHVFNVSQCDGLKNAPVAAATTEGGSTKPEEIVENMPQPPVIKHGMVHAAYHLRQDCVEMPTQERFDTRDAYFTTLFHELVHSTGHEKRLKRSTITESNGFGSDPYCKEELIAEIGAAFLCGQAEIAERTIENSAAYIEHWIAKLKDDQTLIVQAAAQAQKAADFILGRTFTESTEEAV